MVFFYLSMRYERVVLGKNFRVYGDNDNPLFFAKDVEISVHNWFKLWTLTWINTIIYGIILIYCGGKIWIR